MANSTRSPPRSSRIPGRGWVSEDMRGSQHYARPAVAMLDEPDREQSSRSYQEYPSTQPFIRDSYRRPADKPVSAYPESNRQAVMSALKSLQSKIHDLEKERTSAENNLKALSQETSRYRDILNDTSIANTTHGSVSNQPSGIDSSLDGAESRCKLLERQLEYMRRMVANAEQGRTNAIKRSLTAEQQKNQHEQQELQHQIDKIAGLEREHLKLTATQTLAENKIRELEDRLREERHHRRLLQEKSAELEAQTETQRILDSHSIERPRKAIKKKKAKKTVGKAKAKKSVEPTVPSEPRDHYRLNLAEIPFIAGQSTSASHSVPANLQKVLSLMKSHNPKLCSPKKGNAVLLHGRATSSSSGISSSESYGDLTDLLEQLQDEFGHMSFEHQELSRQIHEAVNPQLRDDLERELDNLVARMEVKGNQITKLRRHKDQNCKKKAVKKKKVVSSTGRSSRPQSAHARIPLNGEVEVRTTIRAKSPAGGSYVQHGSTHHAKTFLNDLRKIQTTLGKDDLSWDC